MPHDSADDKHPGLTRRDFLLGSGAATALALYAGEVARHELEVTERTIKIARLPDVFEGYRIVQISDLHLEEYTEDFFLRRVVRRVNELKPDLVLITGDFVSKGPRAAAAAITSAGRCGEILAGLTCPLRYGALGNHDVTVGGAAVADHLRTTGTPILINDFVAVERDGRRLWICGLDDPAEGKPNLARTIPVRPDGPVILMAHEPDYADELRTNVESMLVDLMLSGHSHGGQVRLPHMRPLALPPLGEKYYEGLYRFGRMQLYTNRGIGTVGVPFRLFCPPEITVIRLVSETMRGGSA